MSKKPAVTHHIICCFHFNLLNGNCAPDLLSQNILLYCFRISRAIILMAVALRASLVLFWRGVANDSRCYWVWSYRIVSLPGKTILGRPCVWRDNQKRISMVLPVHTGEQGTCRVAKAFECKQVLDANHKYYQQSGVVLLPFLNSRLTTSSHRNFQD